MPKEVMPKEVLKQTTLETIENRYPLNKWLHVYTDGSQIVNLIKKH